MVIRAGVDDRQMTSALGINIQTTFAIAFAVGAALARSGAVVQSSQGNIAQGQDGLASELARRRHHRRHGVAARRRRRVAAVRRSCSAFSVLVPADGRRTTAARSTRRAHLRADGARARVPAAGAVREGGMSVDATKTLVERVIGHRGARPGAARPTIFTDYWMDTVLTQTFILGIGAASLDLPLRLRRDDLAGADGADGHRRATRSGTWSPSVAPAARRRVSSSAGTRRSPWCWPSSWRSGSGLLFGAVASRSFGIYFLMLTLTYAVIAFCSSAR